MRRLLNTLYVTSEGAWLRKDGENLVMEVEGKERRACHCTCSPASCVSATC